MSKAASAYGWQAMSTLVMAGAQIFVTALLARLLKPEDFGAVALSNTIILLASVVTIGGVRPAIIYKESLTQDYLATAHSLSAILGVILATLLSTLSETLAEAFSAPDLTLLLRILSISFIFNCLTVASESVLERKLIYRNIFVANMTSYLLGFSISSILLALLGFGKYSLAIAYLLQSIIRWKVISHLTRHNIKLILHRHSAKEIFHFSSGVTLSWLFNYTALNVDKLIIGRFLGITNLGFYHMSSTIMDMPRKFLANVVEKVTFPILTRSDASTKIEVFHRINCLLQTLLIPMTIFLVYISDKLILLVLGKQWSSATLPLQILLLQVPLRSITRLTDSIMTAAGHVYQIAWRNFFYMVSVVMLCMLGLPWNINGVATGLTLSVLVNLALSLHVVKKYLGCSWREFFRDSLTGLLAGGLLAISLYFFSASKWINLNSIAGTLAIDTLSASLSYLLIILFLYKMGNSKVSELANIAKTLVRRS